MNCAASELNTVQSNETAGCALEEELGVALFHRGLKRVTLTAAGQRLVPYALTVTQQLEEARRAIKDDGKPRGRLTIGSLETSAALRLSPVLAAYSAAYPDGDTGLSLGHLVNTTLLSRQIPMRLLGNRVMPRPALTEP